MTEKRFLSRKEAAKVLGVKAGTLAYWYSKRRKDSPPITRIGTKPMYAVEDLEEWLRTRREVTMADTIRLMGEKTETEPQATTA